MTPVMLITVNALLMLFIQLGTSWVMSLVPAEYFNKLPWLYKKRRWEFEGRAYERMAIKRWKDKLPEAGGWFKKGQSKKNLDDRSAKALDRFVLETKRGELAHWLQILPCFLFFIWNSAMGGWIILIYAFTFNLPFIAVQRYNRIRLVRTSEKRKRGSLLDS